MSYIPGAGGRVTVYPGSPPGQVEEYSPLYNREELVGNALVAATGEAVHRPADYMYAAPWGDHEYYEEEEEEEGERVAQPLEDAVVYLTDHHQTWQKHYLMRIAKRIHRMVCSELDRSEEALFMLYALHDSNLDGVVRGDEAAKLLGTIERAAPGAVEHRNDLMAEDGSISFVSLLQWYSGSSGGKYRDTSYSFNVTSFTVGLLGSGMVQSDSRLETLDYRSLQRNVVGYRQLLQQLRQFQEERSLAGAQEVEREQGIYEAMPSYYAILAKEFEADGGHLFEIFTQVDKSGELLIDGSEVEGLLFLLDPDASEADMQRYQVELNLGGTPLTFAAFCEWWEQARMVPDSLVSEKGAGLIAGVKARAARMAIGGFFTDSTVRKRWQEARDSDQLQQLREAYCKTFSEIREYKMERDLKAAEKEEAEL